MRIDIVADVICPWCFIGKRRLEAALAQRPAIATEITWRPFQLNPDMPAE
ncbi:MAG: DsbA family protein, partial [Alphaproteobacteria bacterium]|nr:DsbA family protein [Alphaproteobacteria bacterium]